MGTRPDKPGAAVRMCIACGQRRPATAFPPRKRTCMACQPAPETRAASARAEAARGGWTRARGRALRRLALEHPNEYRETCERRLQASPPELSRQKARKRAVAQGLSDLAKQHPTRNRRLYEE